MFFHERRGIIQVHNPACAFPVVLGKLLGRSAPEPQRLQLRAGALEEQLGGLVAPRLVCHGGHKGSDGGVAAYSAQILLYIKARCKLLLLGQQLLLAAAGYNEVLTGAAQPEHRCSLLFPFQKLARHGVHTPDAVLNTDTGNSRSGKTYQQHQYAGGADQVAARGSSGAGVAEPASPSQLCQPGSWVQNANYQKRAQKPSCRKQGNLPE